MTHRRRNAQLGVDDDRSSRPSSRPPARGAVLMSERVELLEYRHVEDAPGDVRYHNFRPGVELWALADGSVLLRRPDGRELWADFIGARKR